MPAAAAPAKLLGSAIMPPSPASPAEPLFRAASVDAPRSAPTAAPAAAPSRSSSRATGFATSSSPSSGFMYDAAPPAEISRPPSSGCCSRRGSPDALSSAMYTIKLHGGAGHAAHDGKDPCSGMNLAALLTHLKCTAVHTQPAESRSGLTGVRWAGDLRASLTGSFGGHRQASCVCKAG